MGESNNIYQNEIQCGSFYIHPFEFSCLFKPDLSLTYISPSAARHLKATPEQLTGKSFLTFIMEENRSCFQDYLQKITPDNTLLTYEYRSRNSNGETKWYQWTIRGNFKNNKELQNYSALGKDITQHRNLLIKTIKRYEAVVEEQMELVCRYLPDGTLTFVNDTYCKYHGKTRGQLIGSIFFGTIEKEDRRHLFAFLDSTTVNNPTQSQVQRIRIPEGEDLLVEWRRRALFDQNGKLYEIQSVGRDITELKKAERALQAKNLELDQKNVALSQVLEQIEQQKNQIKEDIYTNIDDLLIPLLDLIASKGSKLDSTYINLLKHSLEDLISPFGRKITQKSSKLSPREVQICNLIKRGLTSKEISDLLNISLNTVGRHRHSIRKKTRIANGHMNLYTYLQSL